MCSMSMAVKGSVIQKRSMYLERLGPEDELAFAGAVPSFTM